jgi:hypothetical protein
MSGPSKEPKSAADIRALMREHGIAGDVIARWEPGDCELCGSHNETRPYGPNGENVCHPCGMKDETAAKRAFAKRMGLEP